MCWTAGSWTSVLLMITAFSFPQIDCAAQLHPSNTLQREKRQSGPVFSQAAYTFQTQSCQPGQQVGQISAPGAGYYALITTSPNVSVNPYTGQIFLANIFSGATTFQVVFGAFASQTAFPGGPSTNATVTVSITSCGGATSALSTANTANSPPTFSQPSFALSVTSCTAGSAIGSVTLSSSGGASFAISPTTPTSAFTINNNGLLTITGSPLFGGTVQTFAVTATNAFGTATSNVNVNVNCGGNSNGGSGSGSVNNIPPTFSQPSFSLSATSCTAGSPVGSVTVTNPVGVTFAISPTTPTSTFTINNNGLISLTGSPLFGGTAQTFTVTATNAFGSATSNVIVNVNCGGSSGSSNVPPSFTQPYYTMAATSCTAGASVGSVAVTNPAGVTFAIIPTASTPAFTINSNGLISVTGNPLSGTTQQTLAVTATNTLGTTTSNVIINVDCASTRTITPVFLQNPIVLSSAQCVPSGIIGTVTATNSQVYQLQPANPNFSINPTTGVLTLTNRLNPGLYPLTVQATGPGGATATALAQVTINCSSNGGSTTYPTFGQKIYKYRLASGCASATQVNLDQVFASTSLDASVAYSLAASATGFTINSANGLISYTGPLNGCSTFEVIATDTTGRTNRVPVYVDCTVGSVGTPPCTNNQLITFVPATPSLIPDFG